MKCLSAFKAREVAFDNKTEIKDWEHAMSIGSPSLSTLIKYKGIDKAWSLIYQMIFSFAQKFGKRNDLTEKQIKQFSIDFVSKGSNLPFTIADLKMILQDTLNVSKKKFNLDIQGLEQMFNDSMAERLAFHAKKSQLDHEVLLGIRRPEDKFQYDEDYVRERKRYYDGDESGESRVSKEKFESTMNDLRKLVKGE